MLTKKTLLWVDNNIHCIRVHHSIVIILSKMPHKTRTDTLCELDTELWIFPMLLSHRCDRIKLSLLHKPTSLTTSVRVRGIATFVWNTHWIFHLCKDVFSRFCPWWIEKMEYTVIQQSQVPISRLFYRSRVLLESCFIEHTYVSQTWLIIFVRTSSSVISVVLFIIHSSVSDIPQHSIY